MMISEVMTREVRVASPDDTLQCVARVMEDEDFGSLPVAENDRLVGMLTDRDITIRAVAHGLAPQDSKVREIMSTDVRYVYDDESVRTSRWSWAISMSGACRSSIAKGGSSASCRWVTSRSRSRPAPAMRCSQLRTHRRIRTAPHEVTRLEVKSARDLPLEADRPDVERWLLPEGND